MPSPRAQRARESEHRRDQLAAHDAAMRAYERKQRMFAFGGIAVLVAILLAIVIAWTKSSGTQTATGQSSTTASTATTAPVTDPSAAPQNTAPPVSVPPAPAGDTMVGDTPCPPLDGSAARYTSFEKPPPMCMVANQSYDVVIHTTKGDLKTSISNPLAPEIVNNFIVLAAYHYYDGVPIDFAMERGWWEAGGKVEGSTNSPGYRLTYTGPDQLMSPVSIGMALDPGTKEVGGRLVVGFSELTSNIPPSTPVIGLILDGADQSLAIGKAGTQSGEVTEVNTITGMTITLGDLVDTPGSSTTTTASAPPVDSTPATSSPA